MAAYATQAQLLARAGILRDAWGVATKPTLAEVTGFLDEVTSEIEGVLGALGADVPVTDARGLAALSPLTVDLALLRAIDATWPGGRGGDDVQAMRDDLKARLGLGPEDWWDESKRPGVIAYLVGLQAGAGGTSDAHDFWTEESDYGVWGSSSAAEAVTVSPYVLPGFMRGQKL